MAAKLVGGHGGKIVALMPNLRAMVKHFRAFSSYDEKFPKSLREALAETLNCDSSTKGDNVLIYGYSKTVWPDPNLGPFGPQDQRFPMPGLTGPSQQLNPEKTESLNSPKPELLSTTTDRQFDMLRDFLDRQRESEVSTDLNDIDQGLPEPSPMLECIAQDCPHLVKKDFQDLFPDRNIIESALTVITISQKTKNDMTGWSTNVESEREELLDHFVSGAHDICAALQNAGYWADFIDPSSGRPYLGEYTNATLFETDERLRNFGFDIDDLGCCKVINHHMWGTHAYVGCLFTDAPLDHPVLLNMTEHSKTD